MNRAPSAIWSSMVAYWRQPGLFTVVNGLAILWSVPLILLAVVPATLLGHFPFVPILLALLVGIMPNPAAAGLHYCAHLVATDEEFVVADARRALSDYWKPAAALYAFSLISLVMIVANVIFYASLATPIALPLDLIWIYLFFTWVCVQMYLYPLLFASERPSIPLIYRNALVLAFMRPISTVIALVFWLALIVFSSATGILLIAGLMGPALIQHQLARRLLRSMPLKHAATSIGDLPAVPHATNRSRRRRRAANVSGGRSS